MLEFPCPPAAGRVRELEGPKEVRCLLKVGTGSDNFVDEILNTENVILAQVFLNDGIIAEGYTLFVDLTITSFVDQFTNRLEVRFPGRSSEPALSNQTH